MDGAGGGNGLQQIRDQPTGSGQKGWYEGHGAEKYQARAAQRETESVQKGLQDVQALQRLQESSLQLNICGFFSPICLVPNMFRGEKYFGEKIFSPICLVMREPRAWDWRPGKLGSG